MNEPSSANVQRYLRALPSASPDVALGEAIVQRHLNRRRWRRHATTFAVAAMLALALLSPLIPPAMERHAAPAAQNRPGPAWVEIRALDRQLQAAYSSGADADALAQLWTRRAVMTKRLQDGMAAEPHEVSL